MSKKKKYKCENCGEKKSTEKGCVCPECGDDLEHWALTEMYGDDGDYLHAVGHFPGDN